MKFIKAFELIKKGAKIKLPSWGGYWFWDEVKQTIIMHTKDGEELDIRDTSRVEYTLGNIVSDEWIVADSENCPQLGGKAYFSFSDAVRYLKRGLKVARRGWNGKGMYIWLLPETVVKKEWCRDERLIECMGEGDEILCLGSIRMYTHDSSGRNAVLSGWLASQSDILSEDWYIVD